MFSLPISLQTYNPKPSPFPVGSLFPDQGVPSEQKTVPPHEGLRQLQGWRAPPRLWEAIVQRLECGKKWNPASSDP